VTHCLDCGTAGAGLPRRWQRSSFVPRGMAAQRGGDFSLFGRDYGW
jgi:hypothetical protein